MPCVNATGNHKLPLMMIGKSKNPRCFKNVPIPLYYKSSKNAWQTLYLFKEWYTNVFVPEAKKYLKSKNLPGKALLVLDNATCHGTENDFNCLFEGFKVLFLPPNLTPYIQPLDQHVILSMKRHYRKHILTHLFGQNTDVVTALKNINLKDVAYMIVQSWEDVPTSTIMKAFKVMYSSTEEIELNLPIDHFDDEDNVPLLALYKKVFHDETITEENVCEWAGGKDENNNTCCGDAVIEDHQDDTHENQNDVHEVDAPNESYDINQVISGLNLAIEWSESANVELNELLLLRRIREKAVLLKF